jgi:FKBP-type peptidyl-prolyl cis-trans isomerase FkpA/FKBP-type peptidyl-prolyl cis-trans isomerase FklB
MRVSLLLTLFSVATGSVFSGQPAPPNQTNSYSAETYASLGSSFAQNSRLTQLGWTENQFEAFIEGLRATFRGRPLAMTAEAQQLQESIGQRVQELVAQEHQTYYADPARLEAYMKQRAKELRLQRSDSGLAFALLPQPEGSRPGPDDAVVISLEAAAADGQTEIPNLKIDHRRMRVSDLLPGLAEGVQMMQPGSSGLYLVPPALSYGDGTWPAGVERGTPIMFTLKLHEIISNN